MKKIILFFSTTLFVIFSVAGNAQSKFSYGLTGGAGYNFTKLEEASNLNFSLGLRGEFKISEKTDFRTGIFVIQTGSREAPGDCYDCMPCYCPNYTEYDFTFISIPLNLKYDYIQDETKQYYVSFGIMPYLINKGVVRANFPEPNKFDRYVPEIGKAYYSAFFFDQLLNINLSPGLEYKLNEKWGFQCEVELKYSFVKVYTSVDDMFSAMISISFLHF